jgi:RNA polymerase-binding transcription factor DksA
MTKQETNAYRDRLRALAARLGGTVASLEEGVRKPTSGQAAGGLSNAPIHLGDVGTDAFHQELDATLLENEAFIRDEVAAALERLSRGTYGRCESCGRDILSERLETLPYVRHCAPCASRLQSGRVVNLNDGRPEGWLRTSGRATLPSTGDRGSGKKSDAESGKVKAAGAPRGAGDKRGSKRSPAGKSSPSRSSRSKKRK